MNSTNVHGKRKRQETANEDEVVPKRAKLIEGCGARFGHASLEAVIGAHRRKCAEHARKLDAQWTELTHDVWRLAHAPFHDKIETTMLDPIYGDVADAAWVITLRARATLARVIKERLKTKQMNAYDVVPFTHAWKRAREERATLVHKQAHNRVACVSCAASPALNKTKTDVYLRSFQAPANYRGCARLRIMVRM